LIGLEQFAQSFRVKLIVTEVQRGIDRFEGLEIDVKFSFLALGGDDFTTVYNKAIGRDFGVELKTLLCGRNC